MMKSNILVGITHYEGSYIVHIYADTVMPYLCDMMTGSWKVPSMVHKSRNLVRS